MTGYTINSDGSITCHQCGMTSWNKEDATQHYCAKCKVFHDEPGDPHYIGIPSFELLDALKLPLLFHAGGPWDAKRRAEWFRITGCLEATSRVMCDHIRSAKAMHFGVDA
jgi:hypothetical protein